MTTFFKSTIALFIVLSTINQLLATADLPQNYIVVLDLSDRLLNPNQVERDKAIIFSVFEKFEKSVRAKMFINSKDRFRVSIASQVGGVETEKYEDRLDVFMDKAHFSKKRIVFEEFKKQLPILIDKLYREATLKKTQSTDFRGTDLWQYFNDRLNSNVANGMTNKVIVITDGYFDFENDRFVGKFGNRRTDSAMLKKLRNDNNWKAKLLAPNEGLIKLENVNNAFQLMVVEIKPKFRNLNEQGLLITLWSKWMKENKIHCQIEPSTTIDNIKMKIADF